MDEGLRRTRCMIDDHRALIVDMTLTSCADKGDFDQCRGA